MIELFQGGLVQAVSSGAKANRSEWSQFLRINLICSANHVESHHVQPRDICFRRCRGLHWLWKKGFCAAKWKQKGRRKSRAAVRRRNIPVRRESVPIKCTHEVAPTLTLEQLLLWSIIIIPSLYLEKYRELLYAYFFTSAMSGHRKRIVSGFCRKYWKNQTVTAKNLDFPPLQKNVFGRYLNNHEEEYNMIHDYLGVVNREDKKKRIKTLNWRISLKFTLCSGVWP